MGMVRDDDQLVVVECTFTESPPRKRKFDILSTRKPRKAWEDLAMQSEELVSIQMKRLVVPMTLFVTLNMLLV